MPAADPQKMEPFKSYTKNMELQTLTVTAMAQHFPYKSRCAQIQSPLERAEQMLKCPYDALTVISYFCLL